MNLRRKRRDQQMTQEELAERAGLSARYIGAIERGDVSASVTVLGRIAEALGRAGQAPPPILTKRLSRRVKGRSRPGHPSAARRGAWDRWAKR
jgi:transcriptional regulator with XRE-family HTH domain